MPLRSRCAAGPSCWAPPPASAPPRAWRWRARASTCSGSISIRKATLPNVERLAAEITRARAAGALLQRQRGRRGEAGRGGDRDGAGAARARPDGPGAGAAALARLRHAQALRRPIRCKEAVTKAQMDMTLDVMAHSLVYWTQELVRRGLMGRGGRIYAMTSSGGARVLPFYGPVSAAKAALESNIRQLAAELAPHGITANSIRAGVTATPAGAEDPQLRGVLPAGGAPQPASPADHHRRRGAGHRRAEPPRHALDHRQRDRRRRRRRDRGLTAPMPEWLAVILLGVIEGVTEFLPISSTGHLLLVENSHLLPRQSDLFNITIQSGAALAVLAVFGGRSATCSSRVTRAGVARLPGEAAARLRDHRGGRGRPSSGWASCCRRRSRRSPGPPWWAGS